MTNFSCNICKAYTTDRSNNLKRHQHYCASIFQNEISKIDFTPVKSDEVIEIDENDVYVKQPQQQAETISTKSHYQTSFEPFSQPQPQPVLKSQVRNSNANTTITTTPATAMVVNEDFSTCERLIKQICNLLVQGLTEEATNAGYAVIEDRIKYQRFLEKAIPDLEQKIHSSLILRTEKERESMIGSKHWDKLEKEENEEVKQLQDIDALITYHDYASIYWKHEKLNPKYNKRKEALLILKKYVDDYQAITWRSQNIHSNSSSTIPPTHFPFPNDIDDGIPPPMNTKTNTNSNFIQNDLYFIFNLLKTNITEHWYKYLIALLQGFLIACLTFVFLISVMDIYSVRQFCWIIVQLIVYALLFYLISIHFLKV